MIDLMNEHIQNISALKTLVLSQLKFQVENIYPLTEALRRLPNLQHLDLSAAGISGQGIYILLKVLHQDNQLRSLNISENNIMQHFQHGCSHTCFDTEGNAVGKLAEFMHYNNLLHIDIGNMNLSFDQMCHLITSGLRRSRTLQSCHMTGILSLTPE